MGSQVWSGVAVDLQSDIAASKTITAISKATSGVVSSTTHGYSNGDYVLLTITQGMKQVNNRVFRVSAVAADLFTLEGENTTNYDDFVSGGAKKITFGTSLQIITNSTSSGGEPEKIDDTTIHQTERSVIYGAATISDFNLTCRWDPADAGFQAMFAARLAGASLAVRYTFLSGYKQLFYGRVFLNGDPQGTAQGLVTTAAAISRTAPATFYST